MRKTLMALALLIMAANGAHAACSFTSGILPLEIPRLGDSGTIWAGCLQRNFEKISNGGAGVAIEKNDIAVIQRSTLNFVGDGVTVTDIAGKTEIEILAVPGDALTSTTAYITNTSISENTWQGVESSTATIYFELASLLNVSFTCNLQCDSHTACGVNFGLLVDGDFIDGMTSDINTGLLYVKTDGMNVASPEQVSINYRSKDTLAQSSHTVSLAWASADGVLIRLANNTNGCSVSYNSTLNYIASGTAANAVGIREFGAQTNVSLQQFTCPALPCRAQSTDSFDIYVATGSGPGDWMSVRTGVGPE